jgi:DNA-binding CsgD family transcriptional regulator
MAANLTGKDLETVLELAHEAQSCRHLDDFCRELVPRLGRLVANDSIAYNEVDIRNGVVRREGVKVELPDEELEQRLISVIDQHPLAALQRLGELRPHRISDFLGAREFHRLALYQELYKLVGVEDQIAFGLPGDVIVAVAINRSTRTFTDRDLRVLELLRPHLASSYSNLRERERIACLVCGLECGLEGHGGAVIQIDRLGRVVHASPDATELLTAYFDCATCFRLPEPIATWLRTPRGPLAMESARGRLRVSLLDGLGGDFSMLLLEEQRPSPPSLAALQELGLTGRQAQVLRLLVCGKRNEQIAHQLGISRETVRKHLEHIYHKLGVNSRTQAIARILG